MQTKVKTVFLSIIFMIGLAAPSANAGPFKFVFRGNGPPEGAGVGTHTNGPTEPFNSPVIVVHETPPEDPPLEEPDLDLLDNGNIDPIAPQTEPVDLVQIVEEPGPFQSVPEPSTFALLLGVPVALYLRRRAKA